MKKFIKNARLFGKILFYTTCSVSAFLMFVFASVLMIKHVVSMFMVDAGLLSDALAIIWIVIVVISTLIFFLVNEID